MEETMNRPGILYLSATPIGNLGDMTYRAVQILAQVQLIAAEDTRHTRKLLAHYDIHTSLTSYHEHNKFTKGPELIKHLLSGQDLVVVSDAGLPGIADPGSHLAQLAIEHNIMVTPLPGANAALSALICSGLDTTMFTFVGFLPRTAKKRGEVLERLRYREETLLFYEAPHHLKGTLQQLVDAFGPQRRAAAARELTKKFEEFVRGSLAELLQHFTESPPRGEFVIVLEGAGEGAQAQLPETEQLPLNPVELTAHFMAAGTEKKAAIKQAAVQLGLSRRDVYQALLKAENK
jgi:probable S-adenosylmethionine-dependent methyltransferase, YraL family